MTESAILSMWGTEIGYLSLGDQETTAAFEYSPAFLGSGIELSPLMMPLSSRVYQFPELPRQSFHGLPGMLADSLPDKFGHALMDAWLATQGRAAGSSSAVERLCYIGSRGMGALEFQPARPRHARTAHPVDIDQLVSLASEILSHRSSLSTTLAGPDKEQGIREILRVGTSAGGARAKAILAWNPETNKVKSGQVLVGEGFEYWLMKFDGVKNNRDKELEDPQGYGAIEYAYSRMARDAGIEMMPCRLFEEGGRRHFMTKRFDRTPDGGKLHLQSLAGLAHLDFNQAGAYGYEQAFLVMTSLGLSREQRVQQFRRMVFNVVARNQDDHVKNISFLMDRRGAWSLSPAYDVTWSYNPAGKWTSSHQMTLNGKQDGFRLSDIEACGEMALLKQGEAKRILQEVQSVVARWRDYADEVGVRADHRDLVQDSLRLDSFG